MEYKKSKYEELGKKLDDIKKKKLEARKNIKEKNKVEEERE